MTWTKEKNPPTDRFQYDPTVGAARPGCLRLNGDGSFTAFVNGIAAGDVVYVRAKVKAAVPQVSAGWRKGGKWDWTFGSPKFAPQPGSDPSAWRTVDGMLIVPPGADGIGFSVSAAATTESPAFFDDIEVFH